MTRPCTPYENLRRTCIESGGEGHPQHRVPSRGCPQKRRGWCPGSAVCSSTPDAFPAPSPSPPIAWKPFFRFCLPLSRTRSLDAGPGPHKLFWRGGAVGSSRRMLGPISPGPQHAMQDARLPWNQQLGAERAHGTLPSDVLPGSQEERRQPGMWRIGHGVRP